VRADLSQGTDDLDGGGAARVAHGMIGHEGGLACTLEPGKLGLDTLYSGHDAFPVDALGVWRLGLIAGQGLHYGAEVFVTASAEVDKNDLVLVHLRREFHHMADGVRTL